MTSAGIEQWYALRVRSNCEKLVALTLSGKGYSEFLPLYKKISRWSDRKKVIESPLFPGYVFSHFDVNCRLPVLTIPSVVHIVGLGNTPEPIPEEEINAIERFIGSGLPVEPWPFLNVGERVVVEYGSLAGLEGVLTEVKNRHRLVVSLTLLQRSVAVEIDRDSVRPVKSPIRRVAALSMAASA